MSSVNVAWPIAALRRRKIQVAAISVLAALPWNGGLPVSIA